MGPGILIICVGVLVGVVMVAAPRGIWWATESWKFRNPEANEPSDTSYALSRVGGVVVIIVALALGTSIIAQDHTKTQADKREQEARAQREAAEAAFVVPPPESRGALPVIGYVVSYVPFGVSVVLYYTAPSESVPGYMREMSDKYSHPCASIPKKTPQDDGRLDVTVDLSWAPTNLGDMTKDGSCHGNGGTLEHFSVGPFPTTAPVITTSGPILGADGKSVAAPGTVVPRLADVPYPDGSVPDVSDRGVLPVVGYGVDTVSGGWNDGAKYLTVSYLVPVGPSISDYASSNYPAGGCRVDPVVSGLGTPTVTVNVKLSWSDAREHSDQENSACRAGGSKTRVMTSSWGKIADDTTILTDGPIADEGGVVVAGAAPGNRVPEKR